MIPHATTVLLPSQVMAAAVDSGEDGGGPRCIFDERIATLRCRDEADFARIRASVEQLEDEISVRAEEANRNPMRALNCNNLRPY